MINNASAADIEYYKLPKDFASLHNLKDLVKYHKTTLEVQESLNQYKDNLTKYTQEFFNSFVMNQDEVLSFIPESELSQYEVCQQGVEIMTYRTYSPQNEKYDNFKRSIDECLKLASNNSNVKIFLVDTINKKIEICYWLNENVETISEKQFDRKWQEGVGYVQSKINLRNFKQRTPDDKDCDVFNSYRASEYSTHYMGVNDDSVLVVKAEFRRSYSQYECKPNGFGGRYASVCCHGYDIHHFCLKTNRYLGFQANISKYGTEEKGKRIYYHDYKY